MRFRTALLTAFLIATVTTGAQAPPPAVQALINDRAFKTATGFLEKDHDRFVRELITLTEIPAPPFKEKARGQAILGMMKQLELSDVEMDAEGNVMGVRRGSGGNQMLAVLAHMDT